MSDPIQKAALILMSLDALRAAGIPAEVVQMFGVNTELVMTLPKFTKEDYERATRQLQRADGTAGKKR